MKVINVFLITGLLLACAFSARAQATLYVNGSTGSDAVPKASNSATTPWRTIGRAAWGSTNRAAPNASEAASSGDTVLIAGGTYTTTVSVNSRWSAVYNPVNAGTSASPIRFTCVGDCRLGAQNANAPIIGSDGRNYIQWYADVSQGHSWQITAYGSQSGSATSTQVNTTPDTGPVVCHAATGCWIEGAEIDGGVQTDYTDNYDGIRVEACTSCIIRNNSIRNFRNLANTSNGTGIKLYGSPSAIVEHNYVTGVGSAISFKDYADSQPQNNIRVRYNKFDGADRCFIQSLTSENRNYIYQNVCMNSGLGLQVTGGGFSNEWYFNNTFYNVTQGMYISSPIGVGGRFWNNIFLNVATMITIQDATMPATSVLSVEHNVYRSVTTFYQGRDGDRTFESYKTSFGNDAASAASVTINPQLVDPFRGDFRLCTARNAPAAGCTDVSPVVALGRDIFDLDGDGSTTDSIPAGAYVNNNEIIGTGADGAPIAVAPMPPSDVGVN